MMTDPHVYAVGETGLDYYWSRDHVDEQELQGHLAVLAPPRHGARCVERELGDGRVGMGARPPV